MKTITFYILIVTSIFGFEDCKPSTTLTNQKREVNTVDQITKNKTTVLWTKYGSAERQTLLSMDSTGKIKVLAAPSPEPDFLKTLAWIRM